MKWRAHGLHSSRWWVKRLGLFTFSVMGLYSLVSVILYNRMRTEQSHTIARLSAQLPFSVLAGVFVNFSENASSHMSDIYSEWDLKMAAWQARTKGELDGFKAFFMLDLKPQNSSRLFGILDDLVNVYIDFAQDTSDNTQNLPTADNTDDSTVDQTELADNPVAAALAHFLNEIWNGEALSLGGVIQLPTSFLGFLFNDSPFRWRSDTVFVALLSHQSALVEKVQNWGLRMTVQQPLVLRQDHLNSTRVSLSLQDPNRFLQAVCAQAQNTTDLCSQWDLDRTQFRLNLAAALDLVGQDLQVEWSVYWALVDHNMIVSNHKNFVQFLLENNELILKDKTRILQADASRLAVQKNFFENADFSKFSLYLNAKNAQNKLITFLDTWQSTSASFRNLIVSKSGVQLWSTLEDKIADVTNIFDSVQMFWGLGTDLAWTQWQLQNPSDDLFTKDSAKVSGDVLHFLDRCFLGSMTLKAHADYSLPVDPVFRQIGAVQMTTGAEDSRVASFSAQGQIPIFSNSVKDRRVVDGLGGLEKSVF